MRSALVVLVLSLVATLAQAEERPNVLFIAVDDLNDWIGCLGGNAQCKTPNIDALAARGVLFHQAYCAAPLCNPSRTALLTGLRPSTTGVYTNNQPWRKPLQDAITLPEHFRKNGYHVVGGGKIFHGNWNDPRGWEDYVKKQGDPQPTKEVQNDPHSRAGGIVWGQLDVENEAMDDHRITSWAVEELQKKHDKPFFLACGIYKPHMPWHVPRKYYDMYPLESIERPKTLETDLDDVPPAGVKIARPNGDHKTILETGNWKHAVQAYLACITFADDQIGRLIKALDESEYAKNTIIVLWGDHGWHLGEKQHWRKFTLWEEACRAPLMFVVPGVTEAGGVCRTPVDFMNIYPTLCELCDLPQPEQTLDGQSLVSLLKNPDGDWEHPAITTHGRNNHGLRWGKWRYIRYADGSEELYDHETDPLEWNNLAANGGQEQVRLELRSLLPKANAPDVPTRAAQGEEPTKAERQRKRQARRLRRMNPGP